MTKLMIYGATGYTSTLTSQHAKAINLPYPPFSLTYPTTIAANLTDTSVLLNCADPFSATASPLIAACIRNGVHYLDTSAELDTYTLLAD
ncbi:hypothetical protein TI39_contig4510g00001 [Zymoseptoria brevis]|uniref:Saccharopine dehydrogenase NADP binding domain-containing protein n=1 Tax=Zymoseptoria brevis TaxID=1047168 RepID=A0A0F4G6L3_9PEZI|nr:hypothetical protein TI39_contig4510g00001 [Zymoseptoria brevis]